MKEKHEKHQKLSISMTFSFIKTIFKTENLMKRIKNKVTVHYLHCHMIDTFHFQSYVPVSIKKFSKQNQCHLCNNFRVS